jgi:pyridoxal 5'-phosphate synthase pdxS subunit
MASAVVEATAHYEDPEHVAKVSRGLGDAMRGLEASAYGEHLADRGW